MRVAYVVLALSLVPATVVYYRVRATVMAREQTHFDWLAKQKEMAMVQRIPRYVDEMLGLRGLFAANAAVSSEQWDRYVGGLGIQSEHLGLRSLGFLKRVNAGEVEAFGKSVADGRAITIHPEGIRPVYFPVLRTSQTEPSKVPELGLDHYANPALQPAMDMARDSGLSRITGQFNLPDGNHAIHCPPTLLF